NSILKLLTQKRYRVKAENFIRTMHYLTYSLMLHLLWGQGQTLRHKRVYRSVGSHSLGYCVQMVTGSSRQPIGCQSRIGGNFGQLRWWLDEADQLNSAGDAATGAGRHLVAVVNDSEFQRQWRRNFADWGSVSGAIVLMQSEAEAEAGNQTAAAVRWSGGWNLPDELQVVAAQVPIPFPAVLITADTLEAAAGQSLPSLRRLARLHAGLHFGYSGLTNSRRCRRRQQARLTAALGRYLTGELQPGANLLCDSLAEESLAWTAAELPRAVSRGNRSVLLVVARLDQFSVFANWQVGGEQLHNSLAVAASLAGALAAWPEVTAPRQSAWAGRDVALLLLTGESYGHLASRHLADQLLGNGLLGGRGEPAAVKADHVHSIVELGPLSQAGGNLSSFKDNESPPAWSALSILRPATKRPGLLLTSFHGNQSAAFKSSLIEASQTLLRMSVGFLLSGQVGSSNISQPAELSAAAAARLAEAEDCLRLRVGRRCSAIFDGPDLQQGRQALARSLHRWRRGVGVAASLGPEGPIASAANSALKQLGHAVGTRLLLSSLLLRFTLRPRRPGQPDGCPKIPKDDSAPVRGYWVLLNGSRHCQFSSLASFWLGPDNPDNESLPDWSMSVTDSQPKLVLFVTASARVQWLTAAFGFVLGLLWTHLTAAAALHWQEMQQKESPSQEAAQLKK
ncbi:hypothetical protein BOX15_Mlig023740g2, partial [Macrostomum lignano]